MMIMSADSKKLEVDIERAKKAIAEFTARDLADTMSKMKPARKTMPLDEWLEIRSNGVLSSLFCKEQIA